MIFLHSWPSLTYGVQDRIVTQRLMYLLTLTLITSYCGDIIEL